MDLDIGQGSEPPEMVVHQSNVVEGWWNVPYSQLSAPLGGNKGRAVACTTSPPPSSTAAHTATDFRGRTRVVITPSFATQVRGWVTRRRNAER